MNYQPSFYNTVVIYHAGCPDGLAAAWAFTQDDRFGQVYYHFAFERDPKRDPKFPHIFGKEVYIVDFCYPRDILIEIKNRAASVTVLDHHQTSATELTDPIDGITSVFDMERCGAEIVWDYLYGADSRPWWMQHISDRDLWRWTHPDSEAFGAKFSTMPLCFETLDKINELDQDRRDDFIESGRAFLEFHQKEVDAICKFAQPAKFEGHKVLTLNTARYRSECGDRLSKRKTCDFALIYRHDLGTKTWWVSLRGRPGSSIDLSEIAKKYGGGGHAQACGFSYSGNIYDIIEPLYRAG